MGGERLNLLLNRIYTYNLSCCEWNLRPNKLTDLGQWDRPRRKREPKGEEKLGFWEMQIRPEWSRVIRFHQKGFCYEIGRQEYRRAQICAVTKCGRQPHWLSTWSCPTCSRNGETEVTGYASGPGRHHSLHATQSYCPLLVPVYSPGFCQRWWMLPRRKRINCKGDTFLFWILWVSSSRGR